MRFLRSLDPEPFFFITISLSLSQIFLAIIGITYDYLMTMVFFMFTSITWYIIPSIGYRLSSITWMNGVITISLVTIIILTFVHWWIALPILYFITPLTIGYIYPKDKS